MMAYIADLTMVALLIIGLTAFMGGISNGIGEKIFGGKRRTEFTDEGAKYRTGWKTVGGNRK
ncbi:hypothetical protein J1P26_24785 [Neobacillus sp. MM2021_6]|uniref:hypothetical protein n=1 Tax=Bacillaceae TaxID=186817 RepID=UPI00140E7B8F|nr:MULTISPECIES: hypothetical protein [Bacillaceae]MBO0962893.1 hypothetical protein [Neobacillus sp. MM2021_6]NHC16662.1 hypothetical protein [Bacillus sp. MM2020_4]WML38795.1 hypothetical protein RCG19_16560 [Neobacillus sp. OS1-2]